MTSRNALILSLAAAILMVTSPALADRKAPARGKCSVGCKKTFRPNQPHRNTRVSFAMPKVRRPTAKVTTWGVETTWHEVPRRGGGARNVNRDPWKAEMTGYNEGTRVVVKTQTPSKDIVLPVATCGAGGCKGTVKKGKKITNPRKLARKQRSREWRKAVSQAQTWEKAAEVGITVNSHKETQTYQNAAVMPTHTPMRIEAKGTFGRKYATIHTNVQGMKTATQNTQRNTVISGRSWSQQGTISNSGLHVPAYGAWANAKNLYLTPAYGDRGAESVKLLGLAAFPAGSKITVTNLRLKSEGAANHTTEFTASKSGSGAARLAGLQNDKLQVKVSYAAVADRALANEHNFTVRVPRASGRPAIQSRGIRYMAVNME